MNNGVCNEPPVAFTHDNISEDLNSLSVGMTAKDTHAYSDHMTSRQRFAYGATVHILGLIFPFHNFGLISPVHILGLKLMLLQTNYCSC